MASKIEKLHMQGVATLGCIACIERGIYDTPAEIHHARTNAGGSRNHMLVVPLCPEDHRWKNSVNNLGRQYRTETETRWLEYVAEHCPCQHCVNKRNKK